MAENPFRIHGLVTGEFFTDRTAELTRIRDALRRPASKLLVYGYRRMGKSSALALAADQVNRQRGHAFVADLSTASTVADVSNRILQGAAAALGKRWKNVAADLAARLQATVSLTHDRASGLLLPTVSLQLRRADLEDQRATLGSVLDAVNDLARDRGVTIGLVLDEFQDIARFGGEDAEWHLRGVIQRHDFVSYVLAGSKPHLIRRMIEPGRAFYDMLDVLYFGPIDPPYFASWIEQRMRGAGVAADGVGARIIEIAGARTRDITQVARTCFDRAVASGKAEPRDADLAFADGVAERDDAFADFWQQLTPHQQNVLRALAVAGEGLTSAETSARFGLASSSAVSQALAALVDAGRLVREERGGARYEFDSPFLRGWVVSRALLDIGIALPVTYRVPAAAVVGTAAALPRRATEASV